MKIYLQSWNVLLVLSVVEYFEQENQLMEVKKHCLKGFMNNGRFSENTTKEQLSLFCMEKQTK